MPTLLGGLCPHLYHQHCGTEKQGECQGLPTREETPQEHVSNVKRVDQEQ